MAKISFLGSGAWGIAVALVAHHNQHEVKMWSKFPEEIEEINRTRENSRCLKDVKIPREIEFTTDLDIVKDADIVVIGVPSIGVRDVAASIKQIVNKDAIIVNLAKGLEQKSLKRLSQVISEELPDNDVVVLSGPTHAEEVARGVPSLLVVSSVNPDAAVQVQEALMCQKFRVYKNDDVVGVELGGALKNIIAIAAGIANELQLGDNAIAALMTRGLTEIARLGVAMGANKETFAGLTGVGDLIVTCTSKHSRNRRAGALIAQGMKTDDVLKKVGTVEGYFAALSARTFAKTHGVYMPITEQCYAIMYENKDVHTAIESLLGGPCKDENEEIWLL